ncbi:hypothetical protein [uncultured Gilvimarinus sp.]|uniref:hypothetical protein n=1 Tax=uncultured Gilvimarinus sp. TaxID=1689143 RepID=UPI0030DA7997
MKYFSGNCRTVFSAAAFALAALLFCGQAAANGAVGEHVNHLQDHLGDYTKDVHWLIGKVDGIVDTYEAQGTEAAKAGAVVDHWEAVDFHAAIETNFVPLYAKIWQGLYGVKQSVEDEQPIGDVREQQAMLEQALWQALGAVKLAAQYQQQGLVDTVKTTTSAPTTPTGTLDEVKHQLDRVVAKYAEQLSEQATKIVHDTYLHLFEGVEGMLIEQDADLVEALEKDFNVTLPKAIENSKSVDEVRQTVETMKGRLNRAKTLLEKAEKEQKDVF